MRWLGNGILAVAMITLMHPVIGYTGETRTSPELRLLQDQMKVLRQQMEEQKRQTEQRQAEEARIRSELEQKLQALQQQLDQILVPGKTVSEKPQPAMQPAVSEKPGHLLSQLWERTKQRGSGEWGVLKRPSERFRFTRYTPTGMYADPTSFFFIHAYTTLTYADFEKGLNQVPGSTEQILVAGNSSRSGKHEQGFKQDSCLFIGSEVTERLKALIELHLVGNARDPILTESKFEWTLIDAPSQPTLRLVGGRYWWPFGIHNSEWFSAVNAFNLQSPAATEVVPAHWNELGIMAEGEWPLQENLGLTYLVSLGSGVSSFELGDNVGMARSNAFDHDGNLTVTTRVGIFPWVENLAVGASFAAGALRRGADTSYAVSDARRYEADLIVYGFDATYEWERLELRGYWNFSSEDLEDAVLKRLDRNGGTLDALYTVADNVPLFGQVRLKGRFSTAKDVTLAEGSLRRYQYGLGLNAYPHPHFLLKAEYFLQQESAIDEIENNGFNLSGTLEF